MANLIIEAVDQTQTGVASGINTIMRTIGGALGAQIAASMVSGHKGPSGQPAESGFTAAFVMSAVGLVLATGFALTIPRREPVMPTHGIRGVVRTSAGAAVAGATILALDAAGQPLGRVRSGTDGHYDLPGLPLGDHTLVAMAPSFAPSATALTITVPGLPARDLILDGLALGPTNGSRELSAVLADGRATTARTVTTGR